MADQVSKSAQKVQRALQDAGISVEVRELPDSTRTAADAAAAVGCEIGAIASSLIFMAEEKPLLVMTSGAHRVDVQALAARIGVESISRASAEQVRDATGQAIGGVSPVGHPEPIRTLVDESLAGHEQLWAAAGTPHALFPTTFDELVKLTGGVVVSVEP